MQLELLAEAAEAGTPGQAGKLRQHQLRMQVRVLSLAAGLLHGNLLHSVSQLQQQVAITLLLIFMSYAERCYNHCSTIIWEQLC